MTNGSLSYRRVLVWILRVAALVIVAWGVSGTVRGAAAKLGEHEWHVQPVWLVFSGLLYAFGLVPMGWFWNRTLHALGFSPPFPATLRAYFLGHLGKYVPGKAMSVILRVATVRRWVPSMRAALSSALVETLTMMAVGALLAGIISAVVLRLEPIITLAAFGMAGAAGVPVLPPVFRRLASLGISQPPGNDEADTTPASDFEKRLARVDCRLLASGCGSAIVCWLFAGLSLWATVRAIGIESLSPLHDLPLFVAAAAFSVVAGFLSQLPAGLGVRDGLLIKLLVPACGDVNAIVVAVLVRVVWLVSELAVCGILYIGVAMRPEQKSNG